MRRFSTAAFPIIVLIILASLTGTAQDFLPPALPWKGKSLDLIVKKDHTWITPAEKSDFHLSPSYSETMDWLQRLCQSTTNMRMVSIGKSANYRDINMVIASDESLDKAVLGNSARPLLLIQAGIHSGEIDGKDAGMMLLRDIAHGKKKDLLRNCNILFIPILSVDGHERASPYNRVNQRGPENMGWRTNARNLNLNRDYSKLDTEEIRSVVRVMNEYNPDLYLDLHVTDGADYQYDITFGYAEAYSPGIAQWLRETLSPAVSKHLKNAGHIPGPLIFAANDIDFRDGLAEYTYSPRFSHSYSDARHIPAVLVENHSLKPFKQRVLGTYVFLEAVIGALTSNGRVLQGVIGKDANNRTSETVLTWKRSDQKDSINLLGVEATREKSAVTQGEYVVWKGKPVSGYVPYLRYNQADKKTSRPKAFWIPSAYRDVIQRLQIHGITMEVITAPEEMDVSMYRISDYKFSTSPLEGHFTVSGKVNREKRKETFYPGSVRIDLDQPLGDLAILLLNPESPDSFFQWGFFPEIFTRTEYIESYAIEPLAQKMLAEDPKLAAEFEQKKRDEPAFASDQHSVYQWFYSRSPYFDARWLLYPVGEED
jgi:hypothetical protein